MAGQPKLRDKKRQNASPTHAHIAALYAEEYTTFDALRASMVQNGIVEHGVSPFDCIQRAIDDVAMDYMLIRRKIDLDTHGDPNKLEDHPLYFFHEHIREAMVRYSTFAMQYDIQKRQLKLGETRVALLANTLRTVLSKLNLPPDQIREIPRLLINQLELEQANAPRNGRAQQTRLDPVRAEALAEIIGNDAQIEIIEAPNGN